MKCYTAESGSFSEKVNYVDSKNKVLGFDIGSSCCEDFGHGVFTEPPIKETQLSISHDIDQYDFADEPPASCMPSSDVGGGIAFRIMSEGKPDLWVVIWNHHNGYYSHGFTFTGMKDGEL